MIFLKEKYKDTFKHNYSNDELVIFKEHLPNFFNKYFVEL